MLIEKLPKVRGIYKENFQIKNWFDVGGKAEIMFKPADIEDLQFFLKNCSDEIKINIIGAASNIIIRDEGISGVVIKLGSEFAKIYSENQTLIAGAAALCKNVALTARDYELANLEFFTGIPGSIGGAIAMNAGCYDNDVAKTLISVKAIDYQGNLVEIKNKDLAFSYRKNGLAEKFIFVEGKFGCEKSLFAEVDQKIKELNKKREEAQPIRAKTGGSTFKNPDILNPNAKKAWQLIDESGCRGMKINDAQFSEKHCNFMINNANASASDLIELGNKVKKIVKEKTSIDLEWEIKIL
jgi:UDP-N-acetylmuramate dehydrogenase